MKEKNVSNFTSILRFQMFENFYLFASFFYFECCFLSKVLSSQKHTNIDFIISVFGGRRKSSQNTEIEEQFSFLQYIVESEKVSDFLSASSLFF